MQTLNLILPTCWQELTPNQLRYVYYLLATDKFTFTEIKTYVLFRWANIEVVASDEDGFFVKFEGKPMRLTALQIAEILPFLSWLDRLPTYPVRFAEIDGHKAAAADLQGLSFESYLICDNLYQGYLCTQNQELLGSMAAVLYSAESITLKPEEYISIFYWFAAAKELLARRFSHLFQSVSVNQDTSNLQIKLQESMDAQIRALTKGDITKEESILQMDVWRALTELNAQAVDTEELKRQMKL